MSHLKQKSTGTRYTAVVALTIAGLAVSPTLLYLSAPVSYVMILLAIALPLTCFVAAWFQWKKRSRLTIPSLPLRFRTEVVSKLFLCCVLSAAVSRAADLSNYRGFKFGSSVAAASAQAGLQPKDAKVAYQQPALIQTMDWQPRYVLRTDGKTDSVREGTLSFFNNQLYRIVVIYDRYQLEGMTADDMIVALSKTFGLASRPQVKIPFHSSYGETASVLARWEDATSVYDLVATEDKQSFALNLSSKRLNIEADVAIAEARRLDALAEPQRTKDAEQKRLDDDHVALEKARNANKPNFIP